MIKLRPDITFWLQTKRAERVLDNLPSWWGDGLENVIMVFTTENQKKRADERLPILLDLPFKHKGNNVCSNDFRNNIRPIFKYRKI